MVFPQYAILHSEHQKQSDRVRVLKRKLKNSISVNTLKDMLENEKKFEVNPHDYADWDRIDDEAYAKAVSKKVARIELLEELIRMKSHG